MKKRLIKTTPWTLAGLAAAAIGGKRSVVRTEPWLERYIFPNCMLPSASQIMAAAEPSLVLEGWHCFGPEYDRTLMAWHGNFVDAWPALRDRYDERFSRIWSYYLLSCAGSFRAGKGQVWQMLFSPTGLTPAALETARARALDPERTAIDRELRCT